MCNSPLMGLDGEKKKTCFQPRFSSPLFFFKKKKRDQCRPVQLQPDHQDICSDISREHVEPNLQHGEVTHGCEQGGRVVVAYGTSSCLLPYLPPSQPHPPLLSLAISLSVLPYFQTSLCPSLPSNSSSSVFTSFSLSNSSAVITGYMKSKGGFQIIMHIIWTSNWKNGKLSMH